MSEQSATKARSRPPVLAGASAAFVGVERLTSIAIGVFLTIAAVMALSGAAGMIWDGLVHWPGSERVFLIVDHLLFVLMLVEILHTVRASIDARELASEPFLIVGLIATVRRILVVTLQTSDTAAASPGEKPPPPFEHAMIELGVLSVLTLVLIVSIYIARKSSQIERQNPV